MGGGRYWLKVRKTLLTLVCATDEGSEFLVTKGMQAVVIIVIAIIVTLHTP